MRHLRFDFDPTHEVRCGVFHVRHVNTQNVSDFESIWIFDKGRSTHNAIADFFLAAHGS
jgi:hypothetical protein